MVAVSVLAGTDRGLCMQLAVPVPSGSNEGVCFHGGPGGARPASALRRGAQPALRPDDHDRRHPLSPGMLCLDQKQHGVSIVASALIVLSVES